MDELFHRLSSETHGNQYSTSGLHYPSYSQDITPFFPLLLALDPWNDHRGTWRAVRRVVQCVYTRLPFVEQAKNAPEESISTKDAPSIGSQTASVDPAVADAFIHPWAWSAGSWTTKDDKSILQILCKATTGWRLSTIYITLHSQPHWRTVRATVNFHSTL